MRPCANPDQRAVSLSSQIGLLASSHQARIHSSAYAGCPWLAADGPVFSALKVLHEEWFGFKLLAINDCVNPGLSYRYRHLRKEQQAPIDQARKRGNPYSDGLRRGLFVLFFSEFHFRMGPIFWRTYTDSTWNRSLALSQCSHVTVAAVSLTPKHPCELLSLLLRAGCAAALGAHDVQ